MGKLKKIVIIVVTNRDGNKDQNVQGHDRPNCDKLGQQSTVGGHANDLILLRKQYNSHDVYKHVGVLV